MKKLTVFVVFAFMLALVIGVFQAEASSIAGLYNTGVNDGGVVLPAGATDPHYSLAGSASPPTYVALDTYPVTGPWISNTATSKWIAPQANQSTYTGDTNFTYRLSFDLTGLDQNTATITGRWASDNGAELFLNGSSTGQTVLFQSASGYSFQHWTDFTITGPRFNSGVNTLDFVVNNYPNGGINPTGLRVEFTSGTATAVPEPFTLAFLGFSLFGLGMVGRKIKK
jgi:hypothetical protein